MIDLHLHLDGSVPPETLFRLAREEGVPLPDGVGTAEALRPFLTCPADCTSLVEYLKRFDLPLAIMQTRRALAECTKALIRQLAAEGHLYAELRFAPCLHLQKGLTQEEVVETVCAAQAEAGAETGLTTQLILCVMHGSDPAVAAETLRLAQTYLGRGVCAADLAGAETLCPVSEYISLFAPAAAAGLPLTLHAGEAAGPESVRAALACGARRIGHGVRSVFDPALVAELAEKGITLECCPTSNLQTKAFEGWENCPIRPLMQAGVRCTINSDNRTVSGTTAPQEMERLKAHYGLTAEEERTLLLNSAEAAFLPEAEKAALKAALLARF